MTALMLFTRDLRIEDNLTLQRAANESQLVCAVLRQDTSRWGDNKLSHYQSCVQNLAYHLEQLNHELFVITDLSGFDRIYCSRCYNSRERLDINVPELVTVDQGTLIKEHELPFTIDDLPPTFTPFRKRIEASVKTPDKPFRVTKLPAQGPLTGEKVMPSKRGGESDALSHLQQYFDSDHPWHYFDTRNGMLNVNDSTKFSPYLAWGCLSPERIYYELKCYEDKRGSNKSTYWIFFELLWRDYFKFLSLQSGDSLFSIRGITDRQPALVSHQRQIERFKQWQSATTEEPFVNANIIELNQTGWMSNRGRQNVASYLAKTMQVCWLWGAEYFANHLIDYDVESNFGNWAYLAGVGTDPRDRQFNVSRQAEMYDPQGSYQKFWLDKKYD